jgi:hypothetical protein
MILSLENFLSLKPGACRLIVLILLLVPSVGRLRWGKGEFKLKVVESHDL